MAEILMKHVSGMSLLLTSSAVAVDGWVAPSLPLLAYLLLLMLGRSFVVFFLMLLLLMAGSLLLLLLDNASYHVDTERRPFQKLDTVWLLDGTSYHGLCAPSAVAVDSERPPFDRCSYDNIGTEILIQIIDQQFGKNQGENRN